MVDYKLLQQYNYLNNRRYTMNILDITQTIEILNMKHARQTDGVEYLPVNILFTTDEGFVESGFSTIDSWRGVYSEPCLFLGNNRDSKDLLKELYFLMSGNAYDGYKGGRYVYNLYDELNVEFGRRSCSGDGYINSVHYNSYEKNIEIVCTKTLGEYQ